MAVFILLFVILIFNASCTAEKENTNQNSEGSKVEKAATELEAEINAYRIADYTYIYVIRRKDGKPMDRDDKRFVKENSHISTNRFTLNKDETIIFAGSNFKFEEKGLAALKERFEVGDYSKPVKTIEKLKQQAEAKNSNSNS